MSSKLYIRFRRRALSCQRKREVMGDGGVSDEGLQRMREAYERDVAALPPEEVESAISLGGFERLRPSSKPE